MLFYYYYYYYYYYADGITVNFIYLCRLCSLGPAEMQLVKFVKKIVIFIINLRKKGL